MIIDSHSHVFLPADKHLDLMAKEGIDKTILFSTLVHPETASNYSDYKAELSQLQSNRPATYITVRIRSYKD